MTEPLHLRAAEIVAAYGADPARWPDGERATVRAAIAASPELRAAQAAAAALDADLAAWANAPVEMGDAAAAAASVTARASRRLRPYLRWAGGTSLAAAVAAGLLVVAPAKRSTPPTAPVRVAASTPVAAADDATAFAQVFTPTPDEEQSL